MKSKNGSSAQQQKTKRRRINRLMTSQAASAAAKAMNKAKAMMNKGSRRRPTMEEMERLLTCPISHDIMHDPVTLEKSGHVFDRESLCQCLVKNPTKCPLTNTDYGEKLHYADCISIRKLLTMYMGDGAYQRFDDSSFRKEYDAISIDRPVEPDASTLFTLGERYEDADGVEQDYMRARLFYELAAGRGHAEAQYNLGVFYDKGHGVEQDYDKAKYYYEQAAEQGHVECTIQSWRHL